MNETFQNIYETHQMKDPRLPFIFHIDSIRTGTHRNSPYNWHENTEIIYMTDGEGTVIAGEGRIPVRKEHIVVINSNQLHNFFAAENNMQYDCLILDHSFLAANHFDIGNYYFRGSIEDAEIAALLREFERYWKAAPQEEPLRIPHLRSLALDIILLLCERHATFTREPKTESRLLSCIKQAIGYIRAESHRDISLDEISESVGLSKYYFARVFRRITGYSFVSYLNIIRCEKAKELLVSGRLDAGEIGKACGFANQSYFTRTFHAHTGLTPGAYRKKNGK